MIDVCFVFFYGRKFSLEKITVKLKEENYASVFLITSIEYFFTKLSNNLQRVMLRQARNLGRIE